VLTFWITASLWDLVTFAITCLVIVGTLFILQEDGFSSWTEIGNLKNSIKKEVYQ